MKLAYKIPKLEDESDTSALACIALTYRTGDAVQYIMTWVRYMRIWCELNTESASATENVMLILELSLTGRPKSGTGISVDAAASTSVADIAG